MSPTSVCNSVELLKTFCFDKILHLKVQPCRYALDRMVFIEGTDFCKLTKNCNLENVILEHIVPLGCLVCCEAHNSRDHRVVSN